MLCCKNELGYSIKNRQILKLFDTTFNCIASFKIHSHWTVIQNFNFERTFCFSSSFFLSFFFFLRQLTVCISQKSCGTFTQGVLLSMENAHAHKSVVTMAVVRDLNFKMFNYPHTPVGTLAAIGIMDLCGGKFT